MMQFIHPTGARVRVLASVAVVAAMGTGVTLASVRHGGHAAEQVSLNAGTAWFADSASGDVSLLDGATVSRVSEQRVGSPGAAISVVQSGIQSGSGAYVVNQTDGSVTRIDGATLQPGSPIRFSEPGDSRLALVSNSAATWALTQDGTLAEQVDPDTLVPLGPALPVSTASAPIETADGRLWAAGADGYVYSFGTGSQRSRTRPVAGSFQLVEAGSQPVATDISQGDAVVLDSLGRVDKTVPFDPPGSDPTVTGGGAAPYIMSVGPTDGVLEINDIDNGRSSTVAVGDASTTDRYGAAAISGNDVFVPDFEQGAVIVAQVEDGQLALLGQISVGTHSFGLLNYDGSVWFDEPGTADSGVISSDPAGLLEAWSIPKTGGTGLGTVVGHLVPVHFATAGSSPSGPPASIGPATTIGQNRTPVTTPLSVPASTTTTAPASSTTTTTAAPATTTTLSTPAPVPSFVITPTPVTAGQQETLVDTTTGAHRVFQWMVVSSAGKTIASTSATSPRVILPSAGSYTISLVVTENGQSYATQRTITVVAATTTTSFVPTQKPCSNASVTLDAWTASSPTETVTVPSGCTKATFVVNGADGGNGVSPPASNYGGGGAGAQVTVTGYAVTPGEQIVLVGGDPGGDANSNGCTAGAAGCTGGVGGCATQGSGPGGGGMSSVSINGKYVIIAGGGGGTTSAGTGDEGGGTGSEDGTQTAGGQPAPPNGAGSVSPAAQAGSKHQGGNGAGNVSGSQCGGAMPPLEGGGGGGGGLWGGAGGIVVCNACSPSGGSGGGGGSDLVPTGGKAKAGGAATDDGAGVVKVTWS